MMDIMKFFKILAAPGYISRDYSGLVVWGRGIHALDQFASQAFMCKFMYIVLFVSK